MLGHTFRPFQRQHQVVDMCQEAEAYSSHQFNAVDPPSFP